MSHIVIVGGSDAGAFYNGSLQDFRDLFFLSLMSQPQGNFLLSQANAS